MEETDGIQAEPIPDFALLFDTVKIAEPAPDHSSKALQSTGHLAIEDTATRSLLSLIGFSRGEPFLAVSTLLEAVAVGFQAGAAVLWIPDVNRIALRSASHWTSQAETDGEWLRTLSHTELWPLEGLPGRVWAHGRSEGLDELAEDRHIGRCALLAKAGVRSLFGIPARLGAETLAVIELYSQRRFAFHSALDANTDRLSDEMGTYFQGCQTTLSGR